MVIVLFVAISWENSFLGWLAFLGGPFALSALRFFSKKPRPFFPRLGMAVFGPALLIWILFTFGPGPKDPQSAVSKQAPARQTQSK
jgi:hypothetical protein